MGAPSNRGFRSLVTYRSGLVLLSGIVSIGAIVWGAREDAHWAQVLAPPIVCCTLLVYLYQGYFLQRPWSYARRERRRERWPGYRLSIPETTRKAEEYPGSRDLHDAQWVYITPAVRAQGSYFGKGILSAMLPPLAVIIASCQFLAWPDGGTWAIGLNIAEGSCLLFLIYLALTASEPTAEWIENRVRVELLRREQYLVLVGIGPYLGIDATGRESEAARRLAEIQAAETRTLVELIPLKDPSGMTWIESLHRRGCGSAPLYAELRGRMDTYLYRRVGKQLLWFSNEIRDCERNDRIWRRSLTGALLVALIIALIHLGNLIAHLSCQSGNPSDNAWRLLVDISALTLPPAAAASIGVRSMYNFRARSRVYRHERSQLQHQWGALEALLIKVREHEHHSSCDCDLAQIQFDFRAIALRTEHSLSTEMEQWMLVMERTEQEVAP